MPVQITQDLVLTQVCHAALHQLLGDFCGRKITKSQTLCFGFGNINENLMSEESNHYEYMTYKISTLPYHET